MDRLLIVAAVLALVAGAVAYRRLRGAPQPSLPLRVDPQQLGLDATHGEKAVVAFSGPLCHACQQWGSELQSAGIPYRRVDVLHEAGLARAYGVTHTPIVLVVDRADGRVLEGYDDAPDDASVERVRQLVTA
ncbi:MAG: hypothetical protein ACR2JV_03815 [Gaiellales bacterium]